MIMELFDLRCLNVFTLIKLVPLSFQAIPKHEPTFSATFRPLPLRISISFMYEFCRFYSDISTNLGDFRAAYVLTYF